MTLKPRRDGDDLQALLDFTEMLARARRRGRGVFGSAHDEFLRRNGGTRRVSASLAGDRNGLGLDRRIDAAGLPVDPRSGQIAVDNRGSRQRYLGQNAAGTRVWGGADLPADGPDDPATSDELVVTAPWSRLRPVLTEPTRGGLYGDFGLGLGPGFNLHVDRYGVSPSVGAGLFGRLQLGYAPTAKALSDARREDRIFAQVKAGERGIGADYKYNEKEADIGVGPLKAKFTPEGIKPGVSKEVGKSNYSPAVTIDPDAATFGFDGGIGWLHSLRGRNWSPPNSKDHRH